MAPGLQGGMVMMNRRWAESNPRLATAVVKSYLETARRLQGRRLFDDEPALASIERWTKVPPDVVRRSLPTSWAVNGEVNVAVLQDVQRYFMESGAATYREPLAIPSLLDDTYLKAALAEIGTVADTP